MSEIVAKSYRSAAIAIDNDIIQKRETGINNYLENYYKLDDILDLVKLFFGKKCDQGFLNQFSGIFTEEDNTFANDQTNELQVLAGIILYEICGMEEMDAIFRIATYVNSYIFLGNCPVSDEIYQYIQLIYEKEAAKNRDEIVFGYKNISQLSKSVTFSTIEEGQIYEVDSKDINNLSAMVKKINELCLVINKNYSDLMDKNKILYENTELLWWLLTGYSNDENKAYEELSYQQAALLIGKDLAEIVQCKPGPYLAHNLLYRALAEKGMKKCLFKDYIDVCRDETIEKMIEGKDDTVNTPVLYALSKKMETGEGNWIKAFEKKFGCIEKEYMSVDIAYQIYIECLLLKW